jgi:membrane protein YdbS with pleckstrin-like domain
LEKSPEETAVNTGGIGTQERILWKGKPWVLPGAVGRTVSVLALAIVILWLEFSFNWENIFFLIMQMSMWTILIVFLAWIASLIPLLSIRASNAYVLRADGLEIRTGILTSKSFVVAPAGFSDLEVTRSITDRILGAGNIVVRTQGDTDIALKKVRNPLNVADRIRAVMARPSVRIEGTGANQGKLGQ